MSFHSQVLDFVNSDGKIANMLLPASSQFRFTCLFPQDIVIFLMFPDTSLESLATCSFLIAALAIVSEHIFHHIKLYLDSVKQLELQVSSLIPFASVCPLGV